MKTTLTDTDVACEAGNAFGRSVHEGFDPAKQIYPVNLNLRGVSFENSHLNTAVASIQLYLHLMQKTDWHHIMVRAPAYSSLVDALDSKNCGTIPFSCFCDGGGQHRHLIVITQPKGAFNKVIWKKINCFKKNSNIRKQLIESPFQLVNLICHLSQRNTRCEFTFFDLDEDNDVGPENHFNITTPLSVICKPVMTMQWDGGVMEFINHKYKYVDPKSLLPVAKNFGGLWGIRFKNLPGIEKFTTLPISKKFRACAFSETLYLHLLNGKKLYFEETNEPVQEKYFDCISDEIWFPTIHQQRCINLAKPIADQLSSIRIAFEVKDNELQQYVETVHCFQDENQSLKRKLEDSQEEYKNLQAKHIVLLERENDVLRMEMSKRIKTEEESNDNERSRLACRTFNLRNNGRNTQN